MSLDFDFLPLTEDGSFARMPKEDAAKKPTNDYLSQFDGDMWFLPVLDELEKAAVAMAYEYAKLGQPGLPSHLYLKVIYTLSELLRQVDVELEDGTD
jgi:hypothetical protein